MYRLQVMCNHRWAWGIKEYNTMEEAVSRVKELAVLGIKARVATTKELFE